MLHDKPVRRDEQRQLYMGLETNEQSPSNPGEQDSHGDEGEEDYMRMALPKAIKLGDEDEIKAIAGPYDSTVANVGISLIKSNPGSKGLRIMERMGFNPDADHREPIILEKISGRGGIGYKSAKRKIEEECVRAELEQQQKKRRDFQNCISQKYLNQKHLSILKAMQQTCLRLDAQAQHVDDEHLFLKRGNKTNVLYRELSVFDTANDYEGATNDASDDWDFIDDGLKASLHSSVPERIQILNDYLRALHFYCYWCGEKYETGYDLNTDCPGPVESDH